MGLWLVYLQIDDCTLMYHQGFTTNVYYTFANTVVALLQATVPSVACGVQLLVRLVDG